MRFRYLVALIAAAGLAAPAELLAEDAEGASDALQAEVPSDVRQQAPAQGAPTQQATTEGAAGEAAQESGSQTEPTLGAELEPHQDADDVIKETERQFEEASRELDQRFREVEQESPVEPSSDANDIEDVLAPSSDPKVRAALEETERRFEEASREIEASFEQAERDVPLEVRDAARPDEGEGMDGEGVSEDSSKAGAP